MRRYIIFFLQKFNNCKVMVQIFIAYLFIIISLSSCDGPRCIDADDFGFEKIDIPAYYNSEDLVGDSTNQIAPWINSNLRANGDVILMIVKNWKYTSRMGFNNNSEAYVSAWCPWLGKGEGSKLSAMCERLPACIYRGDM